MNKSSFVVQCNMVYTRNNKKVDGKKTKKGLPQEKQKKEKKKKKAQTNYKENK